MFAKFITENVEMSIAERANVIRIESRFRRSLRTLAPTMTRFRSSFHRFHLFALCAATLSVVWAPQNARADEFSLLPLGDPIYAQLSNLTRQNDGKDSKNASLTRYEAALQAARAILDVQNRDPKTVTRANWRSIKALCTSLKAELRQLGVDVEAALALAERGLKPAESSAAPTSRSASPKIGGAGSTGSAGSAGSASSAGGALLLSSGANRSTQNSVFEIPFSQKMRAETRIATQPAVPTSAAGAAIPKSGSSLTGAGNVASQNALALDLNSYLTLRAATSQRRVGLAADGSPLLSGPLFNGATEANAAGGGVEVKLGGLQLSTEVGRLRTNTGAGAARIGGGASVLALQNRLSLGMGLSRVVPDDKAILPSTAAELNFGFDLNQRFSLNLLYQGLFAQAASNSASRVSGGFSLSF